MPPHPSTCVARSPAKRVRLVAAATVVRAGCAAGPLKQQFSGAQCLTVRQELSRQRVGLASPDNSDTHDSNGGRGRRGRRGRRGSGGGATCYTSAASVGRWNYRLHSCCSGGGLETSRSGAGGGPEPADIEGARGRSHGPAAERPVPELGEPESTHRWTGTTCRAAPLTCSDWSEEREVGR
jgi:hypothetical protein